MSHFFLGNFVTVFSQKFLGHVLCIYASPFGPLNARGCVHEPPWGGPPWPPLLLP